MEHRGRNAIVGAVALVIVLLFGYVLSLYLGGRFKPGYEIEATFARAGQLLRSGSDVKLRGVLVGTVSGIDVADSGKADVTMRIFPEHEIPSNIGAAIRAKTLFGEKFIELRLPDDMATTDLQDGDSIPESRTIPPIEVESILEKAVPILAAVDPEKFGEALHTLAEGLSGNEQALRNATDQSLELLTETERTLPSFERNLVHLRHFAKALNDSDTGLVQALNGLSEVGEVLTEHPDEFRAVVSQLGSTARDLGDVLTARQGDLGDIAGKGRAVLDEVGERATKLPAVVNVLDSFLAVWVADLSVGPNWRIWVTDPPIVGGTPYPPGTEPTPAAVAQQITGGSPDDPVVNLLGIVLQALPVDDLVQLTNALLGGSR